MKMRFNGTFAAVVLVWAVMLLLSAILYVFSPKSSIASYSVSVFYTIWVAAALHHAFINGGLNTIGLPGKRWLIAIFAGIIVGLLAVSGNKATPEFKNAVFLNIPALSMLTLITTGTIAAYCEVVMIMGYYHFSLEKSCGRTISIIITSLTWTTYHFLLIFSPGSVPSTSMGVQSFIIGIFVGSLIITLVTSFTKSILAAFIMNLMSNIIINWLRISVSPKNVLIADNSFPVAGIILIIAYIAGGIFVHKKTTALKTSETYAS